LRGRLQTQPFSCDMRFYFLLDLIRMIFLRFFSFFFFSTYLTCYLQEKVFKEEVPFRDDESSSSGVFFLDLETFREKRPPFSRSSPFFYIMRHPLPERNWVFFYFPPPLFFLTVMFKVFLVSRFFRICRTPFHFVSDSLFFLAASFFSRLCLSWRAIPRSLGVFDASPPF